MPASLNHKPWRKWGHEQFFVCRPTKARIRHPIVVSSAKLVTWRKSSASDSYHTKPRQMFRLISDPLRLRISYFVWPMSATQQVHVRPLNATCVQPYLYLRTSYADIDTKHLIPALPSRFRLHRHVEMQWTRKQHPKSRRGFALPANEENHGTDRA